MTRFRFLSLAAVWLVATAAFAAGPEIVWQTLPETAATAARAEAKLLLVHFRGDCGRCNDASDAMFSSAATDEVFRAALDSFVLLRTEPAAKHAIVDDLLKRRKAPLVAIYDASGAQLALFEPAEMKWQGIAETMLAFRAARSLVAKAAEARLGGDHASADFMLGHALLRTRDFRRAAERLDRAASAFEKRGEKDAQQLAEIAGASAWFASGSKKRGQGQLEDVLRNNPSKAVAAEGYLQLGGMYESQTNVAINVAESRPATFNNGRREDQLPTRRVVTKNASAARAAISAYRKAYDHAAPGSSTLEAARAGLARLTDDPLPPKEAAAAGFRVAAPARTSVTGHAEFLALGDPAIARVEFFLDGKRVATAGKAPFRVNIDVGPTARARTVTARAFDARGNAVGESVTTINDRADAFVVSIVSPVSARLNGSAEVELDVRVPPGRKLVDVELSWNGTPLATLTQPPFRGRVSAKGEVGYLRALARLDDGTTSEAAKLFNAEVAETVDVSVVTLIASVTDGRGKRVTGLGARDFVVLDNGQPVAAELRSAEEEPVTIGIAVDSSSSMAGNQLYVIRAAAEIIARGMRAQDEAFVVAFDISPRLVHPRSKDPESLRRSVLELVPRGGTSLYDGVTFALQQFQGIPGKRALIVLTDGRELTSTSSAREAESLSRLLGVPVYVIIPPRGDKRGALMQIADITGGVVHYAPAVEEFASLADRIADELRGQYVLSFPTPANAKSGEWRTIRVSVPRRDVTVRTIQGYRAN